jgi:sterol 3beta-glucosyltransferase
MSKVVIAAIGSRGDVAPLTGLGVRLQRAGHGVVLAAYAEFDDLVRGCGLEFRQLDPARIDHGESDVNPIAGLREFLTPSGQRAIGENMIEALRDEPADVLLLSPLAEFAGHPLAEAKGVPGVGVRLQPLSATSAYPPAVLGSWSAGSQINSAASNVGAKVLDRLYGHTIVGFREKLGLPYVLPRELRRRRTTAKWPILYGYSPSVLPRPADWRSGIEVVGFWWPARPTDWKPPAELVRFLDDGPAPVFVGFGSLLVGRADAERMSETVATALRIAGVRGVIQAGWAGMNIFDDDVLTIGDVPHDWLFDRMAAVVHHCGVGTAAGGLRAGVPAVAVPSTGDQPFWAQHLLDLGVSAATIPQRRITAERLAAAIDKALTDNAIRHNVKDLAEQIAAEDGAGRALAIIDEGLR